MLKCSYMEKIKRIVNFRPLVVFCDFLIISILIGVASIINGWYAFLLLIPLMLVFLMVFLKNKYINFIFAIAIVVGFLGSFLSIKYFNKESVDGVYWASGKVCEMEQTTDYGYYVYVDNVKISSTELGKGQKLSGKTIIYYDNSGLKLGDYIYFKGRFSATELDIENVFLYRQNIKYNCSVLGDISVTDSKLGPTQLIRQKTKENLDRYLSEDNAGITYAVLFGDKTFLNNEIYNAFKIGGTAHILAVSGLHIGFLIVFLLAIMSLFRIKKWYKFGGLAICLFVYCYICGFAPSVVRASIMGLCILLGNNLGREKDVFSNIALSAIIILIFRPLYLFDMGFLMSYGAVLGIILLLKPFQRMFGKNKVARIVAGIVGVTICAQLGILPITCSLGSIPTYSIITNIITVPIFGIAYILLCFINLIVLIMPFMSFLFVIMEGLFSFIVVFNQFIIGLPGSYIKSFGFGILASIIFYVVIFGISKFVMLKNKVKLISCCLMCVICVTIIVLYNLPIKPNKNQVLFVKNQEISTFITTQNGEVYIVGTPYTYKEYQDTLDFLNEKRWKISGIIMLPDQKVNSGVIKELADYTKAEVYAYEDSNVSVIMKQINVRYSEVEIGETKTLNSITFEYVMEADKPCALYLINKDKKILFTDGLTNGEVQYLEYNNYPVNILLITKMTDIVKESYLTDNRVVVKKYDKDYSYVPMKAYSKLIL